MNKCQAKQYYSRNNTILTFGCHFGFIGRNRIKFPDIQRVFAATIFDRLCSFRKQGLYIDKAGACWTHSCNAWPIRWQYSGWSIFLLSFVRLLHSHRTRNFLLEANKLLQCLSLFVG